MSTVKEEVLRLVKALPDDATWETAMYEICVRQKIVAGEEAFAEGRSRRSICTEFPKG